MWVGDVAVFRQARITMPPGAPLHHTLNSSGNSAPCQPNSRAADRTSANLAYCEYDEGLLQDEATTLLVELPWRQVPGALCLLQEAGEVQVVLQSGAACLRDPSSRPFRKDVAISMALAYVELGREVMAEEPPLVAKGCEYLETALKLLQEEGGKALAPQLQKDIDATLEQMAPRCVLELLALPLDLDHEAPRQEGLSGLRAVLWAVGTKGEPPASVPDRATFMKEAFHYMTAAEQVALFVSTPESVPAESYEVYAAALAHIAEGFSSRRPRLIQDADALLGQLQATGDEDLLFSAEVGGDVKLERAMCALLTGNVDGAVSWLGLDPSKGPFKGDRSVRDFILAASPDGSDLLPGLCLLAERWLREVLYPSFRDLEGRRNVVLTEYFDDPSVKDYLEGIDRTPTGNLAAKVSQLSGFLKSLKITALQTLSTVFPDDAAGVKELSVPDIKELRGGKGEADEEGAREGAEASAKDRDATAQVAAPASAVAADASSAPTQAVVVAPKRSPVGAIVGGTVLIAGGISLAAVGSGLVPGVSLPPLPPAVATAIRDGKLPDLQSIDLPATPKEAMARVQAAWGSYRGTGTPLGGQPQAAAFSASSGHASTRGGSSAQAAAMAVPTPTPAAATQQPPPAAKNSAAAAAATPVPSGVSPRSFNFQLPPLPHVEQLGDVRKWLGIDGGLRKGAVSGPLDTKAAEEIVRRWQSLKAAALGPEHNAACLKEILSGPMLGQWTTRADDVAKNGWYWKYKLESVRVDRIVLSEGGRKAIVDATLEEGAQLFDRGKADVNDAYKSTYTARYEIRMIDNAWRIVRGVVLR
eukprot:jgi/Mesvir1/28020/Mv04629-RA.1